MEVIAGDGTQIRLNPGQTKELGRSNGFKPSDNTISRRHISIFIPIESNSREIRLQFEVLGINPIYVSRGDEVNIFRRFERGEMGDGDMFCVSAKKPVWYTVRELRDCREGVRRNVLESELEERLESGSGFEEVECLQEEGVDFSHLDPVKEFGFVVEGHEFDSYPKKMIKSFKDWEWFLEEGKGKDSEDDDEEGTEGKSRGRRKRKKGAENDDDDEWSGESEDDKVLMDISVKGQRPKYKTRSKDHGAGTSKRKRKSPTRVNREVDDEDEEDEDEEDETLGGFIVDDENLDDAKDEEDDEDEEELVDEDEEEE